ncbi:response regulator transcription factor [Dongia rigui]|uniref:Response regulator transcription factor n=1 Tax=Dongia rigui TaxID=940149 RepID=A0ABU5DW05_9PROT|nr:response regulator transcription factor [Dongia rigui]MDY0871485.1 response regulator transcription factor [Dongia rigui]
MTTSTRIPKPRPPSAGMPWRILLADDHAMVREALSQMLEGLDAQLSVTQAPDFPAAAALLEKDRDFAVVLLDYKMPGMKGAASLRELADRYPGLQVGIISGYLGSSELEPLVQAGAIGVFPKTMTGPALIMALKLALSGQTYVPWSGDLGHPDQPAAPAHGAPPPDLTKRQIDVLQLLVKGAANKEIAHHLGLSEVTIKVHVAALCRKFGVANRTQLAMTVFRVGIGRDEPGAT